MLDRLLELFIWNWPAFAAIYAVGGIAVLTLRGRPWILPLWGALVAPCLCLTLWLAFQLVTMMGLAGSGPDGGFVGMKMGYGLLLLCPLVIALVVFVLARPRRAAWRLMPILATGAAIPVLWGGVLAFSQPKRGGTVIELRMLDVAGEALPGVELELQGSWGAFTFRQGARWTSDASGVVRVHPPPGEGISGTVAPRTDRWQQVHVTPASSIPGSAGGAFAVSRHWHGGIGILTQSFSGELWRPGDPPIAIYLADGGAMRTLPYCAAIPLEAGDRTPAERRRIVAAAENLEGFRFLPLYGRWLSSRDASEADLAWRAIEALTHQLAVVRYAVRDLGFSARSLPAQLRGEQRRALEGLGRWAGAGAATEPGACLAAIDQHLTRQERDIAKWVLPCFPASFPRALRALGPIRRSLKPLVIEALPSILAQIGSSEGRTSLAFALRSDYELTTADAEPFLSSAEATAVAAGCFLLRAVQHQHRAAAAARIERLRPLLTDPAAIAECEASHASLRE